RHRRRLAGAHLQDLHGRRRGGPALEAAGGHGGAGREHRYGAAAGAGVGRRLLQVPRQPVRQRRRALTRATGRATGERACGQVKLEVDVPVFWAWHDHSEKTRRAQGCAYATYVGVWKSKLRVVKGAKSIAAYEDKKQKTVRSFCSACGTPLTYERGHSP